MQQVSSNQKYLFSNKEDYSIFSEKRALPIFKTGEHFTRKNGFF